MRKAVVVVAFLFLTLFVPLTARAQGFNSGSTGADGPLDLSTCSSPACAVQLPESGVLNYTTVNIPSGKALSFNSNLRNTPVIMLAQGNVTIGGVIVLDASNGPGLPPGPGGFHGAAQGGQSGFGPGGGQLSPGDPTGKWVGPLSLVPIIGGSGGAMAPNFCCGGSGGGAIVIASSTSISISSTGVITARGASGGGGGSGGGSGGAIRLVANSITMAGQIYANSDPQIANHDGVVRLEAPAGSLSFTGTSNPTATLSTTINPAIIADSNTPALTITSIAGFAVPSYTTARPDVVDLLLPSQLTDPLNVLVHGHNIPLGTQVNMNVSGSAATVTSATLSGTLDSSTATLTVSGLSRTVVSTLYVFATFTPPGSGPIQAANPKGPDRVASVRVEAAPGAKPRFFFLRSNGTVIDKSKVPRLLLEYFGL